MSKLTLFKLSNKYFLLFSLLFAVIAVKGQLVPNITIYRGEIQYAISAVAGDADMDGDIDVVVSAYYDGTFLYRNLGGGVFGDIEKIFSNSVANYDPSDIFKIVDIDNDGDGDLIKNATWYRNNGPGILFTSMGTYAPSGITANGLLKDMNGDGLPDDIGCSSNNIVLLHNNGNGNFIVSDTIDSGGVATTVFSSFSDIDGDNIDDLAIGGNNTYSGLYFGLGNGQFGNRNIISQFATSSNTDLMDVDGDGYRDLIAYGGPGIRWWRNDGAGSLTLIDTISNYTFRPEAVGDFDGDNDLDFSLNTGSSSNNAILQNDSSGILWSNRTVEQFYGYSLTGSHYASGDLDNDNDADLITANSFGFAGWYPDLGNGSIGERKLIGHGLAWGSDLDAADIDSDGDQDLLSVSNYGKFIALYYNNGDGTFTYQQEIVQNCQYIKDAAFVDLNADGLIDIITNSADCPIVWNTGSAWNVDTLPGQLIGPMSTDVDSDGDPDLMGNGCWYQNDGFGNFFQVLDNDIPIFPNYQYVPNNIDSADFNGDGILDYIYPCSGDTGAVLLNDGNGDFEAIPFPFLSEDIDAADMDQNGFADIVLSYSRSLYIYFNDGNGNFNGVVKYSNQSLGDFIPTILTYDFDKDGDMDVISSWSVGYNHSVVINRNTGFGDLGPIEYVSAPLLTRGIIITEIDNNSWPDVAFIGASEIKWSENWYSPPFKFQGSVFADFNQNVLIDSNEYKIPYHLIRNSVNTSLNWTNFSGDYSIGVLPGINKVWTNQSSSYIITNNPDTITRIADTIQPIQTDLNFGLSPVQDTSATLTIYPLQPIRCNATTTIEVKAQNTGITLPSSILDVYFHPDITINSFNPTPDSIVGNHYFWHTDSINFLSYWTISANILIGPIGTNSKIIATFSLSDSSTFFITDSIGGVVTCSYDPNEKQVSPAGYGTPHYVNKNINWLTYTISFQNTGTDTSQNVMIRDLFDPKLNWSTLTILAASHSLSDISVDNFGLATFMFDDIMLPDSLVNEPQSHGFIKYKIALNSNVQHLSEITNEAHIYFDYNVPVTTNMVKNTLVDCSIFSSLITYNGIDSIIATVGESYQWLHNGNIIQGANSQTLYIDTTGDYSLISMNSYGCVLNSNTISVTCSPAIDSTSVFICYGDSFYYDNSYIYAPGTYIYTYPLMIGCDSIIVLTANFSSPLSLINSNDTLFALQSGSYQWYNCVDSSIIGGETQIFYVPTSTGNYACIIDQQGCVDTTSCITVVTTAINDILSNDLITITNPVYQNLYIHGLKDSKAKIVISDIAGKILLNQFVYQPIVDVSFLADGIYFIAVSIEKNNYVLRFVKNHRDNVK